MLLSVMEIISSTASMESLLIALISAIIALLGFVVVKKRYELYQFRKHSNWSFVQPFEE